MKTLVGFFEHRLRLSQESSEFVKKKWKRGVGDASLVGDAGLYFVPNWGSNAAKEYLLVVPQALLTSERCGFYAHHQKVQLWTILWCGDTQSCINLLNTASLSQFYLDVRIHSIFCILYQYKTARDSKKWYIVPQRVGVQPGTFWGKVVCNAARFSTRRVKVIRCTIINLVDSLATGNKSNCCPEVASLELGMLMEVTKQGLGGSQQADKRNGSDWFLKPRSFKLPRTLLHCWLHGFDISDQRGRTTIRSLLPCRGLSAPTKWEDALSCVLVMKGDRAFSCRAGMFLPGDKVVINSVQCQWWRMVSHVPFCSKGKTIFKFLIMSWWFLIQTQLFCKEKMRLGVKFNYLWQWCTFTNKGRWCCIELTDTHFQVNTCM